ncbi:hypothetical protein B296_00051205 [Ensete ventricosum]|uniref:PPPDE domain-containing protein n=1 Tax=Ensete ventricosum TaxID=4639 RepID=A0A426XLD1_ENSVE|nr:hypothetical protein B296_00051205 [Ensete ventricosum]
MSNRVNMVSRSSLTKSVSDDGGKDGSGRTHLYLNVYDLTPVNKYLYWFGLGVFHSGIEGAFSWSFPARSRGGTPYPRVKTLVPQVSKRRVATVTSLTLSSLAFKRCAVTNGAVVSSREATLSASRDVAAPERRGDHLDVASRRRLKQKREAAADVRIPSTVLKKSSCGASLWQHRTYDHLRLHLSKQFGELPLVGFLRVSPCARRNSSLDPTLSPTPLHLTSDRDLGPRSWSWSSTGRSGLGESGLTTGTSSRSVWLGTTDMSRSEFRLFIEDLAGKYHGDTYHLIIKNCNHFTDEVCMSLTGKPIPGWVNRLARLDDESDLFAWSSADESDEEDADCHPLKKPNIDFVHSIDEPLRLARDVM